MAVAGGRSAAEPDADEIERTGLHVAPEDVLVEIAFAGELGALRDERDPTTVAGQRREPAVLGSLSPRRRDADATHFARRAVAKVEVVLAVGVAGHHGCFR